MAQGRITLVSEITETRVERCRWLPPFFARNPRMNRLLLAAACLGAGFCAVPAHAQKESIGMFYELQLAPTVCKWTDAADPKKLDGVVARHEKALEITPDERAKIMKDAEDDLRSDPSVCAPDGEMRQMYDASVK
jgi:hypothetical protein